eukprot:TRINITY_DN30302_c0_g1_i2.p2 TRINITY_DN30302_c0_g1~~TRINITY_DN30302_c0_g1_i2.p2  ORF type:complete len:129 (+),score=11.55 TRINITY_DN30302_c0_g1_i2:107-493(+)
MSLQCRVPCVRARPQICSSQMYMRRPNLCKNDFVGSANISRTTSIFTGQQIISGSRSGLVVRRVPFLIECNAKKSMGCTKEGTKRAAIRTSGFRTRMRTPGGRRVLKARRKKGKWVLCPVSNKRGPKR